MDTGGRVVSLVNAIPRSHENRPRARRLTRPNIQPPIADHHGAVGIELHLAACLFDQARAGFPAAALLAVVRNDGIRMVRTDAARVDAGASERQAHIDRLMHFSKKRLVDHPAADRRLIGDDHGGETRAIEEPDRVRSPREQVKQLQAVEIRTFLDERPVPIQKNRGPHQIRSHSLDFHRGLTPRGV